MTTDPHEQHVIAAATRWHKAAKAWDDAEVTDPKLTDLSIAKMDAETALHVAVRLLADGADV